MKEIEQPIARPFGKPLPLRPRVLVVALRRQAERRPAWFLDRVHGPGDAAGADAPPGAPPALRPSTVPPNTPTPNT